MPSEDTPVTKRNSVEARAFYDLLDINEVDSYGYPKNKQPGFYTVFTRAEQTSLGLPYQRQNSPFDMSDPPTSRTPSSPPTTPSSPVHIRTSNSIRIAILLDLAREQDQEKSNMSKYNSAITAKYARKTVENKVLTGENKHLRTIVGHMATLIS
tara:strand:- start:902 stop:1363 length:462 start_codon:yes stop_codon:yes gene_type:complete